MDHGNNQTRSAIPQAVGGQLNRGRIRRLLGSYRRPEGERHQPEDGRDPEGLSCLIEHPAGFGFLNPEAGLG